MRLDPFVVDMLHFDTWSLFSTLFLWLQSPVMKGVFLEGKTRRCKVLDLVELQLTTWAISLLDHGLIRFKVLSTVLPYKQ